MKSCLPDQLIITFGSLIFLTNYYNYNCLQLANATDTTKWTVTADSETPVKLKPGRICAVVRLSTTDGGNVTLAENEFRTSKIYESVHYGKLRNSIFSVLPNNNPGGFCVLEICGYNGDSSTGVEPFKYGSCEWYTTGSVRAPSLIYNGNYEVSSLSCACTTKRQVKCLKDKCDVVGNSFQRWTGATCAILYQEKNCRTCVFQPILLEHAELFQSRNSFQFKSVRVRPGCRVEKHINGVFFSDGEYTEFIENTTSHISPAYHKDSENYTCFCEKTVLLQMQIDATSSTTSMELTPIIQNLTVNTVTKSPSSSKQGEKDASSVSILQFALPSAGILLFLGGSWLILKFWSWKRVPKKSNVIPLKEVTASTEDESLQPPDEENESFQKNREIEQLKKYIDFLIKLRTDDDHDDDDEVKNDVGTGSECSSGTSKSSNFIDQFNQICAPEFKIPGNAFTTGSEQLGSGYFGVVFRGSYLNLNPQHSDGENDDGLLEDVAVKRLKWSHNNNYNLNESDHHQRFVQSFLREIKIFHAVGTFHENVVRFIGAGYDKDGLYILTRYCANGSMKSYLREKVRPTYEIFLDVSKNLKLKRDDDGYDVEDFQGLEIVPAETEPSLPPEMEPSDLQRFLQWSQEIAGGMDFLHSKKIIHVDLAIRNILLCANLSVKICDFGLSRKLVDDKDYAESLLSTQFPLNSIAPECNTSVLQDGLKMSVSIDVWAYGCTLWEIFSFAEVPYKDLSIFGVADFLRCGKRLPKPHFAPQFVYEKLLECWHETPHRRPSFAELKTFFKKQDETFIFNDS